MNHELSLITVLALILFFCVYALWTYQPEEEQEFLDFPLDEEEGLLPDDVQ